MDALFADGPGRLAVDARIAVAIFKERVTIMNDRERFEEWAKNSGYALLKTGLNQYFYTDTAAAWDAWQAARAQQAGSGEAVACRHFWASHSHTKGMECINCGIEKPGENYSLSGNYKRDVDSLIRTIEMLKSAHPSVSAPNLSNIAQKKLDQMGATVHGVLVKNEAGAWAAVSDAGRVMWLDGFEGKSSAATPWPADCNNGQNCEHCEPEHGCKRPNPPAEGSDDE